MASFKVDVTINLPNVRTTTVTQTITATATATSTDTDTHPTTEKTSDYVKKVMPTVKKPTEVKAAANTASPKEMAMSRPTAAKAAAKTPAAKEMAMSRL
ncbi:uncharacterized protein LAESUDRAFT_726688 [Laetiporus sulphureus 93-53]|uniref:Uncharacterized protein n=1 Tax=Laetiporus sulphureus 93-53 TaxID=1314785 RepID=A0A165DW26_9APHY|nr:uncharacterized protein LAESUDRAFT_726688 [Laetiporus sulphureus 93-53]KZT05745.1 hypothetical protein LAESUDRAFT_726688 [Laetiporus sulphureus 93-53]